LCQIRARSFNDLAARFHDQRVERSGRWHHLFDFVIETADASERVLIVVKRRAPARNSFRKQLERMPPVDKILLVSDEIDVGPFQVLDPRLTAIAVRDRADSERLASTLGELLQLPNLGMTAQRSD
jgi:hypothetical protein